MTAENLTRYARDQIRKASQARHESIIATLAEDTIEEFNEAVSEHKPKCVTGEFPSPWVDWDKYPTQAEDYEKPMPTQEQAEALCKGCPIARDNLCIRYALASDQSHGVWNGQRIYNGRIVNGEYGNGRTPGWSSR